VRRSATIPAHFSTLLDLLVDLSGCDIENIKVYSGTGELPENDA
jgi:hypothetical protein